MTDQEHLDRALSACLMASKSWPRRDLRLQTKEEYHKTLVLLEKFNMTFPLPDYSGAMR